MTGDQKTIDHSKEVVEKINQNIKIITMSAEDIKPDEVSIAVQDLADKGHRNIRPLAKLIYMSSIL